MAIEGFVQLPPRHRSSQGRMEKSRRGGYTLNNTDPQFTEHPIHVLCSEVAEGIMLPLSNIQENHSSNMRLRTWIGLQMCGFSLLDRMVGIEEVIKQTQEADLSTPQWLDAIADIAIFARRDFLLILRHDAGQTSTSKFKFFAASCLRQITNTDRGGGGLSLFGFPCHRRVHFKPMKDRPLSMPGEDLAGAFAFLQEASVSSNLSDDVVDKLLNFCLPTFPSAELTNAAILSTLRTVRHGSGDCRMQFALGVCRLSTEASELIVATIVDDVSLSLVLYHLAVGEKMIFGG
ncbi:hypothetical protein B0H10DRAFT_945337 [Mycena sp. CBHHK59/15]|nr:hypothetical protein B0H10DRAFT_945337 [Mycena sp. CBHHK59/15]